MTNSPDVSLTDSNFAISLSMSCAPDVTPRVVRYKLPLNTPVSMTLDKDTIPGADYSLTLENCTVPLWFLFMNNVSFDAAPMDIFLENCPMIIPSFLGTNFKGTYHLPIVPKEYNYQSYEEKSLMLANQTIEFGNVRVHIGDEPCAVYCWGIYVNGMETDLTFIGESNICELFFECGSVRLYGDTGLYNLHAQATTYDVGSKGRNTGAFLHIRDCTIAHFDWNILGQITAWGDSKVLIENCKIGKLQLIACDSGQITLRDCTVLEELVIREQGGTIAQENVVLNK